MPTQTIPVRTTPAQVIAQPTRIPVQVTQVKYNVVRTADRLYLAGTQNAQQIAGGGIAGASGQALGALLGQVNWITVGAIIVGIALVIVGVAKAMDSQRKQQLEIAGDIAPAVLGMINPLAGAGAEVALKAAAGKSTRSAHRKLAKHAGRAVKQHYAGKAKAAKAAKAKG